MKSSAIEKFVGNIERLMLGEDVDLYESMIDSTFEYIAGALLGSLRETDIWYDGTKDLTVKQKESNQLEFSGNILVAKGQDRFWNEPFSAIVTDKRNTNQGVVALVCVGEYKAEGNLYDLFT